MLTIHFIASAIGSVRPARGRAHEECLWATFGRGNSGCVHIKSTPGLVSIVMLSASVSLHGLFFAISLPDLEKPQG